MKKRIAIEGNSIRDIPSFYEEINRVLMQNEDWKLGHSLDALNDLMYGDFGVIKQDEPVQIVWLNSGKSKDALGFEVTKAFYLEKLTNPSVYNDRLIREKLADLEKNNGPTFFEIVMDIIAEHPNIELTEF